MRARDVARLPGARHMTTLPPPEPPAPGPASADARPAARPAGHTAGPLAGLKVLDLTLARAGPTCTRHLADWGADVIRIEPPAHGGEAAGARAGADYQNLHRNKRLATLDLKTTAGREAFMRLAAGADVIVENMRAPVKRKLAIAYEDVRPINPRIVYGSVSGFGQSGPYAERALVDQIAQGMGGLMSVTGEPGRGPMRAGAALSDVMAGTLCARAIMMALHERNRTGVGRYVHTSLIEAMIFMMDFQAARFLMEGEVPGQVGNQHPTLAPMSAFQTADGWVNLAASTTPQWRALCAALGRPDWAQRPEWKGQTERGRRKEEIHAAIAAEIIRMPTAHWVELLAASGLPCGPIYRVDQMFADPQIVHLQVAGAVRHPTHGDTHLLNSPINMEGLERAIRAPAPLDAADTETILREIGYTDAEIAALRAAQAI
jgi:formyl-CoA transferase